MMQNLESSTYDGRNVKNYNRIYYDTIYFTFICLFFYLYRWRMKVETEW